MLLSILSNLADGKTDGRKVAFASPHQGFFFWLTLDLCKVAIRITVQIQCVLLKPLFSISESSKMLPKHSQQVNLP